MSKPKAPHAVGDLLYMEHRIVCRVGSLLADSSVIVGEVINTGTSREPVWRFKVSGGAVEGWVSEDDVRREK